MIFLCQGFKIHPEDGIRPGTLPAAGLNGTVKNRFCLIRDHQIRICHQPEAETCTAGAGAAGIVEGEHPGLQLCQADAAVFAGIVLREIQFLFRGGQFNGHKAPGMGAGCFNGIRQTAAQAFLQYQAVHHQFNGVLLVLFRLNFLCQIIEDAIHPDTGKSLLPGIFKYLLMLTLFSPDDGRQHNKPGSFPQGFNPVHNLINGLPVDLLSAFGAMGNTHSRPQQAKIIINFRHGAHGRPGILGSGLLVNRDRRRKTVNGIHIRFVHLTQKLPGIGRETFHIPALAFGIDGIKGKAGFSGTGETRKYHQFIPGNGKIHIF